MKDICPFCGKNKDIRATRCNSCARKGKLNHGFKGFTYSNGYKYLYFPNHPHKDKRNFVAEHRLVMEKHLGRYLNFKEEIHHIDGNKLNNNIKNLKLFKNKNEHMRFHRILEIKENKHNFIKQKNIK